jgi:hypothetical protein
MHLYPIDGAVHRVDPQDTAWNCRDATGSMVICGIDPNPGKAPALKPWGRALYLHAATSFNEIADRAEKLERSLNGQ